MQLWLRLWFSRWKMLCIFGCLFYFLNLSQSENIFCWLGKYVVKVWKTFYSYIFVKHFPKLRSHTDHPPSFLHTECSLPSLFLAHMDAVGVSSGSWCNGVRIHGRWSVGICSRSWGVAWRLCGWCCFWNWC